MAKLARRVSFDNRIEANERAIGIPLPGSCRISNHSFFGVHPLLAAETLADSSDIFIHRISVQSFLSKDIWAVRVES